MRLGVQSVKRIMCTIFNIMHLFFNSLHPNIDDYNHFKDCKIIIIIMLSPHGMSQLFNSVVEYPAIQMHTGLTPTLLLTETKLSRVII